MARTLSDIYQEAKTARDARLELTEFHNGSKMSILDAFTWVTAACIWSFENLLDVFKVDVASDLQNRINGTPQYYANALLKYQHGDELQMNDEGTQFSYPSVDVTKRIITKVAYSEVNDERVEDVDGVRTVYKFFDKDLILKIATGEPGMYSQVSPEVLTAVRAYMQKIAFAGTHMTIVSRKGDILIPKVVVYYDGGITEDEMYNAVEAALNSYIANLEFDGAVYVQKIIDTIQRVEHVTDVFYDAAATDYNGVFVAQYDDDNNLISDSVGNILQRIPRFFIPNSGYLKQSTNSGEEAGIPKWEETIKFIVEKPNTGFLAE